MERMTWNDICSHDHFRGRWVALDGCLYDDVSGKPKAGAVVDADEQLVALCSRIRDSKWKNCAILFCELSGKRKDEADDPFAHSAH
jgi:hypothetical protein